MSAQTTLEPAEMERAFFAKDASYDGLFFVGVRTTVIFCKPTCPARAPLPKNIEYLPSARAALVAKSSQPSRVRAKAKGGSMNIN